MKFWNLKKEMMSLRVDNLSRAFPSLLRNGSSSASSSISPFCFRRRFFATAFCRSLPALFFMRQERNGERERERESSASVLGMLAACRQGPEKECRSFAQRRSFNSGVLTAT